MAISRETIQKLEQIRDSQSNRDSVFVRMWQEVAKYIDPTYGDMQRDSEPRPSSKAVDERIYDSTVSSYSNVFAMGLQGYVCSSQSAFFSLVPEEALKHGEEENKQLAEVLQSRTRQMYACMAQRGFYAPIYPCFKSFGDLASFVMFFKLNKDDKIVYEYVPNYQCVPLYNRAEGTCDTIFRSLWLTAYEARQIFGEENLPTIMQGEKVDETKAFQFWELLCPRDRFGFKLSDSNEWEHLDIIWSKDDQKVVFEGGTRRQGFCLCTFSKNDDSTAWGVGSPGLRQFHNARCLQNMSQDLLIASQYAASPAIMKSTGFTAKIAPAAFIDIPPGASMTPLELGQDLSWTTTAISDRRSLAKSDYFVDYFLMLSQYSGNVNTATLAQGLQNEQLKMMTHFLDSLRTGFFEPVIDWTWNTMGELGYFDDGYDIDYKDLQVDFVSPLYILQKQAVSLEPTVNTMNTVLPFLNIDPTLVNYFDFGELVEVVRESTNADARIVRDKKTAEEMIQAAQRAQQEEIERQAQIQQQDADTRQYAAATKAPEQGSIAQQLASGNSDYSNLKLR